MDTLSHDDAESKRNEMRKDYAALAHGYIQYRDELRRSNKLVTDALKRLADIHEGQRVLDLACGVGDPTFAIVEEVGSSGYVVGLDISEAMVEGARRWAHDKDIKNVEFHAIANELELDAHKGIYDAAICQHGLMYMDKPVDVLRGLRDCLKSGGHVAVSTWGVAEHCPYVRVTRKIVGHHIDLPRAKASPYPLTTRDALEDALVKAGFDQTRSEVFVIDAVAADSPEAWWDQRYATALATSDWLGGKPKDLVQAIREDMIRTLVRMFQDKPVVLTGEVVVAGGRNPAN
jgi:ubiquinone/menaquinone biosynthesis C-methylase UbiE